MKYFWISMLCVLSSMAMAADRAGEVVFTVGDASVRQDGTAKPLKRGDALYAGNVLTTGNNGYIHIHTVDQGFVSLRPGSRLIIEQYRYDPANPRLNAIKFRLEEGVMRSVTGKGGEAAKDRFRLNTPVAAIGIRGTDFSVFTTSHETRVSIRTGGVAVSPLNDACQAAALGACSGASVLDLYAGKLDQVLQIRRADSKPAIIRDPGHKLSPDTIAPPLQEEKDSQTGAVKKPEQSALAAVLPGDSTLVDVTSQKQQDVKPVVLPALAPAAPAVPVVTAKLEWGRWDGAAGSKIDSLLTPDREVVGVNSIYLLTRTKDKMALPEQGSFSFNLTGAEAQIVNVSNLAVPVDTATVSNGTLSVDFGKRQFSTSLTVSSKSLPSPVNLQSANVLDRDGKFGGEYVNGNMRLNGSLNGNGTEAHYVFNTPADANDKVIQGITHWKR